MADVLKAKVSGLYRGLLVAPSQCSSGLWGKGEKTSNHATIHVFRSCSNSWTVSIVAYILRVMLQSIRIKKVEVVRNFAIIAMMVLARFIAASSRTCVHSVPPKKACTEYTARAFLHRVGITKPAVSVQCTKRNTSTTPLEHWTDISISELKAMLSSNNIQLFDVREPYELVEMGKIACATNIPCM